MHEYINIYVRTYIHKNVRVAAEDRVQSQISPCGILVDKVALGSVFLSEYFGFPNLYYSSACP